jgi:hypothetical protein
MLRLLHRLLPPELHVLHRIYKRLERTGRTETVIYTDVVDAPSHVTDSFIASLHQVVLGKSYVVHLQQKNYLEHDEPLSDSDLRIRLTADGFELARKLDSVWGTANYLYQQHKDGILGLVLTILVSVVTAYITTILTTGSR